MYYPPPPESPYRQRNNNNNYLRHFEDTRDFDMDVPQLNVSQRSFYNHNGFPPPPMHSSNIPRNIPHNSHTRSFYDNRPEVNLGPIDYAFSCPCEICNRHTIPINRSAYRNPYPYPDYPVIRGPHPHHSIPPPLPMPLSIPTYPLHHIERGSPIKNMNNTELIN
jgi:hypothetical protein